MSLGGPWTTRVAKDGLALVHIHEDVVYVEVSAHVAAPNLVAERAPVDDESAVHETGKPI
jgi:hypothetical protein